MSRFDREQASAAGAVCDALARLRGCLDAKIAHPEWVVVGFADIAADIDHIRDLARKALEVAYGMTEDHHAE